MKTVSSIRSKKTRSRNVIVVKRKGILRVIDKLNPRNNCRQGRNARG